MFTLRHLAHICGVRYRTLHESVNRKREASNYRMFAIQKRSGGRRFIHAVTSELMKVQKFVNAEILQKCQPHPASFAFHPNGGIRRCAEMHCGARWLFQFDLTDFFYDVTEVDVYRIFQNMGYRRLVAFELARLCTTTRLPKYAPRTYHRVFDPSVGYDRQDLPYNDQFGRVGVLPQGAPSSPILANLAAERLDESLLHFATQNGFVYTRYADDITVSATNLSTSRGRVRSEIIRRIRESGFRENSKKCHIAGPGAKKLVLGLLVDGNRPRLSRATHKRIERLLYGVMQNGFASAAAFNRFDSAYGFHNHLCGLVAFVKDVDQKRWQEFSDYLKAIKVKWAQESAIGLQ